MTERARSATHLASDGSLVELAQGGDADAFERLIDQRLDRAYRTALAIVRTDWDARDACQDAFVAAWRELPRLRDPQRFDAWFDRIVVNQCRMLLRRRRARIREIPLGEPDDGGVQPVAASAVDHVADQEVVRQAIGRLSPDQRMVLTLHHGEGRPVAEIGRVLGIPAGTVMWRLYSARRALEKILREVSG